MSFYILSWFHGCLHSKNMKGKRQHVVYTHAQTRTQANPQMLLSHLLSCNVHVPYDDAAVTAAGDELTGVWGVAQTLNFITA